MIYLTPTRGQVMLHRVLVLVQLGQDTTLIIPDVNQQLPVRMSSSTLMPGLAGPARIALLVSACAFAPQLH
jgi:hypothetical protein